MATWGPTAIAADNDNGYQEAGFWTPAFLFVGNNGGSPMNAGFRWTNVTVPSGATINSASINFVARNAVTGTITNVHGTFKGMAYDNVNQWAEGGIEPTGTQTTASTDFDPTVWVVDDTDDHTYDVTSIVAEIVGRAGWTSGNALAITLLDDSTAATNYARMYAYGDGLHIPTLTINYTTTSNVTISPSVGAQPHTGRVLSLGIGINMPDQP